jgi:RNA recognition motif-containing protein
LFVFHLPQEVKEDQLAQLFSPFGKVLSAHVASDPVTQQSRGYGFVNMSTVQEANNAIYHLNGYRYNGKYLKVAFKQKRHEHEDDSPPTTSRRVNQDLVSRSHHQQTSDLLNNVNTTTSVSPTVSVPTTQSLLVSTTSTANSQLLQQQSSNKLDNTTVSTSTS